MTSEFKIKQVKSAVAFLASAFGVLAMAIINFITDITGGNPGPVGKSITLHSGIGPYSGKQTISIVVWIIAWLILSKLLVNKDVDEQKIFRCTIIIYALATLLIFPPFLDLFD
jgi:hypothetical protein